MSHLVDAHYLRVVWYKVVVSLLPHIILCFIFLLFPLLILKHHPRVVCDTLGTNSLKLEDQQG